MRPDLVLTPGGYRSRSLVTHLEPGHALHMAEGRVRIMHMETKAITDIPHISVQPGDVPGFGTGWIVYGYWINNTGTPVSSFRTTWRVPPAPTTHSGQTIFLFNGIDPSNPSAAILQPVLQWGVSAAGGGPYWSVASWYVLGNGQAFHTNLVPVNVGDQLVGLMKLTGQANGQFSYTSEFQGMAGTTLPVQNVAELVWCNETLEAYSITACSDYPNADFTAMRDIHLSTGSAVPALAWTPVNRVIDCGQHAVVASNSASGGDVNLYYREPRFRFNWAELAQYVQILFGVTNDGGGIIILPNGHIIHVPPGDPLGPVFRQIAEGLADVGRGIAVRGDVQGTSIRASAEAIDRESLELMAKGLERALQAIGKAKGEKSA